MVLAVHLYRSDTHQWMGQLPEDLASYSYLEWEGQTWAILERSHHYHLKGGVYLLHRVSLFVRPVAIDLKDRVLVGNRYFIGDPTCRYNAQSELLRCVPNPTGPCTDCGFYEKTE